MPRGDRAKRRLERDLARHRNAEHYSRMAQTRQSMLGTAQSYYHKGQDQSMRVQTHGFDMASRKIKLVMEVIRFQHEMVERRIAICDKWLKMQMTREQLINMRRARAEWESYLKQLKREYRAAKKEADKMRERLDDTEVLAWGETVSPDSLKRGWRGLVALVKTLPRNVQRTIMQLRVGPKHKLNRNFFSPGRPDVSPPHCNVHGTSLWQLLMWCKQKRLAIADASPLQQQFYNLMGVIDLAAAKEGAQLAGQLDLARKALHELRSPHWKAHKVI